MAAHEFEGAAGSHMGTLDAYDLEQGRGSHLGTVEKNDAKDAKGKHLARADKKSGPDTKPGVSTVAGPIQGAAGGSTQRRVSDVGYNERLFARREQQRYDNTAAALKKLFNQDPKLRPYKDNPRIEQIGAGLRIQLLDTHKTAMFPLGSAEMLDKQTR